MSGLPPTSLRFVNTHDMETPLRTNTEILIQPLLRLPTASNRLYNNYEGLSRGILMSECKHDADAG